MLDSAVSVLMQVRICTRMGVQLVSTDFNSKDYYSNIRKAMVAGYFMQVRQCLPGVKCWPRIPGHCPLQYLTPNKPANKQSWSSPQQIQDQLRFSNQLTPRQDPLLSPYRKPMNKCLCAGGASRAHRPVSHRQGQSNGVLASVHVPGPQARMVSSA